jgi:hypothetical protein
MAQNLYELLEVSREATQNEIKAAMIRLGKIYASKAQRNEKARADFSKLRMAYKILSSPYQRANYNISLKEAENKYKNLKKFKRECVKKWTTVWQFNKRWIIKLWQFNKWWFIKLWQFNKWWFIKLWQFNKWWFIKLWQFNKWWLIKLWQFAKPWLIKGLQISKRGFIKGLQISKRGFIKGLQISKRGFIKGLQISKRGFIKGGQVSKRWFIKEWQIAKPWLIEKRQISKEWLVEDWQTGKQWLIQKRHESKLSFVEKTVANHQPLKQKSKQKKVHIKKNATKQQIVTKKSTDVVLTANEKVIYQTMTHWFFYLDFGAVLIVIFSSILLVFNPAFINDSMPTVLVWVPHLFSRDLLEAPVWRLGLMALLFVGLMMLWEAFVIKQTTELGITSKRVIFKRGLLSRSIIEIKLRQFESITIQQSPLGLIFNYGTITITGMGGVKTTISNIVAPFRFKKILWQTLEKYGD